MTQLIYRSSDPRVLEWARSFNREIGDIQQSWEQFRDAAPAMGLGSEPRKLQVIYDLVVGFQREDSDTVSPIGWKLADNWVGLVPDTDTEIGREIQTTIDKLPSGETPPLSLNAVGMPETLQIQFPDGSTHTEQPSLILSSDGTEVFCAYQSRQLKVAAELWLAQMPDFGWTEMPRSEWYLRIETAEAAAAAPAAAPGDS